jgi:hypothetical protein
MLEKADETMRTLTEVLVQASEEEAIRTERLGEALPALESRARTLTIAADRIAGIVDELRGRQKRPEREVIE